MAVIVGPEIGGKIAEVVDNLGQANPAVLVDNIVRLFQPEIDARIETSHSVQFDVKDTKLAEA